MPVEYTRQPRRRCTEGPKETSNFLLCFPKLEEKPKVEKKGKRTTKICPKVIEGKRNKDKEKRRERLAEERENESVREGGGGSQSRLCKFVQTGQVRQIQSHHRLHRTT